MTGFLYFSGVIFALGLSQVLILQHVSGTVWTGFEATDWEDEQGWTEGVPIFNSAAVIYTSPPPQIPGGAVLNLGALYIGTGGFSAVSPQLFIRDRFLIDGTDVIFSEVCQVHIFGSDLSFNQGLDLHGGKLQFPGTVTMTTRLARVNGELSLQGPDSFWDTSGEIVASNQFLTIGNEFPSRLDILFGARVLSGHTSLATGQDIPAEMNIFGQGSLFDAVHRSDSVNVLVNVGSRGEGLIHVQAGGTFLSRNLTLGGANVSLTGMTQPGTGKLVVRGSGSRATVRPLTVGQTSVFEVGRQTYGRVEVLDGGLVQGAMMQLGINRVNAGGPVEPGVEPPVNGEVFIEGAGSRLELSENLTIGLRGQGHVTVLDGGHLSVPTNRSTLIGGTNINSGFVNDAGKGTLIVRGVGSRVTLGSTHVGTDGDGLLFLGQSAHVSTGTLTISGSPVSSQPVRTRTAGVVEVGGGSLLETLSVSVGNGPVSEIHLRSGGRWQSRGVTIGHHNPAASLGTPEVLLEDFGTEWSYTQGTFNVFTGTLTVRSAARLTAGPGGSSQIGAAGRVFMHGPGSLWTTRDFTISGHLNILPLNSIMSLAVTMQNSARVTQHPFTQWDMAHANLVGSDVEWVLSAGSTTYANNHLRLTNAVNQQARIVQNGGILRVNRNGTNGFLEFGPGVSSLRIAGGSLWIRDPSFGQGIRAVEGAQYEFILTEARIAATGRLTVGVDATLTGGSVNLIHSGGHLVEWLGRLSGGGDLRKLGPGTLWLAGDALHQGSTTVSEGQLTLSLPLLADDADLVLEGDAVIELLHNQEDIIGRLVINGASMPQGVWGAPGHPQATFTSPRITGSGLLRVTSSDAFLNTFARWMQNQLPSFSEATGEADDLSRDGMANLLVKALGGNPAIAGSAVRPAIQTHHTYGNAFVFNRIAEPMYLYEVWASEDLQDWGNHPVWTSFGDSNEQGLVEIPLQSLMETDQQMFLQLRVTSF
ncbi:MAG: hypothetical protein LR015_06290 [Verrucomicrobia bacterium]|nr:hypothetical protein [Verrucomicrobiota bacterium]